MLHGLWVVVFSVALLGLVQEIPMAVLAGLLVHIGAKLVKTSRTSASCTATASCRSTW